MPELNIYPENPLIDEKILIKISSLTPCQSVTVHITVAEQGARFAGCGCYVSDDLGDVDTATSASLHGTYTGIDEMGLFWSMKQEPGQSKMLRLIKRDVNTPLVFKISVYAGHLTWDDIYSKAPEPLVYSFVQRWYKAKNVRRIAVRDGRIRGALFIPEGIGPFPGVLDLFGGTGGLIDFRAALMASRGFVSLSLAYIKYEDIKYIESLDYFQEAIDYVLSQPLVKQNGVGVVGVSAGGGLALSIATHCNRVKAVVDINGPPFPLTEFWNGNTLIKLPRKGGLHIFKGKYTEGGISFRDCYYEYEDDDIYKVWNRDVDVLCIIGEDDMCISPDVTRAIYTVCPKAKNSRIQVVEYPGAGHLIEPPYTSHCRISYVPPYGISEVWGGRVREHAFAQENSWRRILTFLRQKLDGDMNKSRL